jgi:hypothetical protein
MWLRARIAGRPGQHGNRPPDIAAMNSRTTRSLSAAAHLRQVMQPDQVTDPGTTAPRPALPVGRAYALRVLFSAEGAIPAPGVDMRRVRKHCLLALVQTIVRDLAALTAVVACFLVDQWGIGFTLAILLGAAIVAGRSRVFLPLMAAATIGAVVTAVRGNPAVRAALVVPLACLAVCFGIYLLDLLLAIFHVRRLFRKEQSPPQRERPAPVRPLTLRTPAESEYRRWGDGNGHNGDGHNGNGHNGNGHNGNGHNGNGSVENGGHGYLANGNGNGSREPDQDAPDRGPAIPSLREPERVYFGRNGIIGWGVPLRAIPLTIQLDKPLDPEREIGSFSSSDLVGAISRQWLSQSAGDGQVGGYARRPASANGTGQADQAPEHFSHGLPNLEVTPVVMTPIPEPDQLPGSPIGVIRLDFRDLPSGDKLLKLADQSPAGRSERHYLRASTLSFDGQLGVSIYVNVILEGHYVRLLIRPYVLQPLVFDLVTTADLVAWNPLVLAYYATTMTIRGFLNLAARIGRGNDETGKAGRAKPAKAGLRSTRESYARPYVNNIHQAEDSSRIAQVLEEKIFTATMEFLRKRNIDIEDYQRQIQSIMLSYTIMGDAVITPGAPNGSLVANVTGQGTPNLAGQGRAAGPRPAAKK